MMVASSQEVLIEVPQTAAEGTQLAEAFSEFIAASSRLELSYRDLQAEVAELSQALSERNRALSESLSENAALSGRLQRILEVIPCGVLVLASDGCIRLANPEAARLLSLPTEQDTPAMVPDGTAPGLHLHLQPQERLDSGGDEQEILLDGSEGPTWVAVRRVQLPGAMHSPMGSVEALVTLRDISVRKRMEGEREAVRDAVALAQVSALLAHEIRNPLASLELFAGLLEQDRDGQEEWLSHLRAGIRSLSGIVNNVLTLHGNTPLTLGPVDAMTEAALAIEFLQPLAKQAKVTLRFRNDGASEMEPRPRVRANRGALHQILINLCVNALRHTPAEGLVEVMCQDAVSGAGGAFRIAVRDNGSGIPAEHLRYLFDIGFSGSGTTSGLGLAVCDRLVRQMGGTLTVTSQVGQGSSFALELSKA